MKRVSTAFALVLGAFVTYGSAAQIQGFISGYASSVVDEYKKENGVEKYTERHSDFMWGMGAEFLAFPAGPLMVGGGLGFFSVQKDGGENIVMPSIPLWGSVGVIGPETWSARPYLEFRVGYLIPAARFATWWDKPLNYFVTGAIGVQLPYHMGVEFDYSYLVMDKYFKAEDVNFSLGSAKFGGSITVHFDLSKSAATPDEKPAEKASFVTPPEAEDSSSENTSSEESSYTGYGDPAPEESTEEPVSEESLTEPAEETASYEETAEQGADEGVESAIEETPADEPVAEEAAAEEAAAEDPVEEAVAEEAPAEEPAVAAKPEPAPEKKVNKKDSKKAKALKNAKKAKKNAKKAKKNAKKTKKTGKKAKAAKKKK